jgi:hypothetical protein
VTPRAWQAGRLLPAGEVLRETLSARAGGAVPGTPASLPVNAPVVGDLVGADRLTIDDLIDMHRPGAPGHPHHALHQSDDRPNNPLTGEEWDG